MYLCKFLTVISPMNKVDNFLHIYHVSFDRIFLLEKKDENVCNQFDMYLGINFKFMLTLTLNRFTLKSRYIIFIYKLCSNAIYCIDLKSYISTLPNVNVSFSAYSYRII